MITIMVICSLGGQPHLDIFQNCPSGTPVYQTPYGTLMPIMTMGPRHHEPRDPWIVYPHD